MADQAAPKVAPPVLTPRDQELMVLALRCLENGEIKIDYAKFATEGGFKDKSVAGTKWSQIKRKIDSGAKPAAAATGAAAKSTNPKTPRKPKEPKEFNTPASTTKKLAKSPPKAEEEVEDATSEAEANGGDAKMKIDSNGATRAESSTSVNVATNDDSATKDADGDSTMVDTPEPVHKGKGKASVAEDMSTGDMSPPATPAPTKAKRAATPKATAAPKTPKTPKTPTSETADTAPGDATQTPLPSSSGAKKRGRKGKAQKEAEAAAAAENGTAENGDDDESEKPAKKARKAPTKKAKKEEATKDGEATGAVEGGDGEETPVKKQRKTPVKKPKDEDVVENGEDTNALANDGKNGETAKALKPLHKPPVKEKNEGVAPASEGSPAGEVVKARKKPGPKPGSQPGAAKAKKVATAVESAKSEAVNEEEQKKMDQEAAARVIEAAELANAVLDGKKIDTKTVSIATAHANPPNWGAPINSTSPSPGPTNGEMTSHLGKELAADTSTANDEDDDGDTIVVAS